MPESLNKRQLVDILKERQKLVALAKEYPLSISKLWTPHCHRYDGLGNESKRPRGCGKEMDRVSSGIWRCQECDITESRSSQIEPAFSLGREATLISVGKLS